MRVKCQSCSNSPAHNHLGRPRRLLELDDDKCHENGWRIVPRAKFIETVCLGLDPCRLVDKGRVVKDQLAQDAVLVIEGFRNRISKSIISSLPREIIHARTGWNPGFLTKGSSASASVR